MRAPNREAEAADFVQVMGPVARELLGEPTKRSRTELRFGMRGSMSVSLDKGTWHDFESGTGGGVFGGQRSPPSNRSFWISVATCRGLDGSGGGGTDGRDCPPTLPPENQRNRRMVRPNGRMGQPLRRD